MSKTEIAEVKPRSLPKGLIAGLIGGLVGAVAMTFAERMVPPQKKDEQKPAPPPSGDIHWEFGAAVGAAYGALAEYYPAATAKEGAAFGMAIEALTQEGAGVALGLPAEPTDPTTRERASEMTSHVVYGITTEWVRRLVRKLL